MTTVLKAGMITPTHRFGGSVGKLDAATVDCVLELRSLLRKKRELEMEKAQPMSLDSLRRLEGRLAKIVAKVESVRVGLDDLLLEE